MKKILLAVVALAVAFGRMAANRRIASYNIRNGIGADGRMDRERLAETIRGLDADIIGVQEVDSVTGRSGGAYVLGELAQATGMTAVYASAIDFDGGRYGIGMLCRVAPDSIVRVDLPGREEARTALICLWPDLAVCCTHLSLTDEDRLAGGEIAARKLAEVAGGRTMVMLGDFNTQPYSELWPLLDRQFGLRRVDGFFKPTYPSDFPAETIDYILIGGNSATASEIEVVDSQASDHRPIVCELK